MEVNYIMPEISRLDFIRNAQTDEYEVNANFSFCSIDYTNGFLLDLRSNSMYFLNESACVILSLLRNYSFVDAKERYCIDYPMITEKVLEHAFEEMYKELALIGVLE